MRKQALFGLIIIALSCGLLWRIELEYHGWAGLKWLSYFHWAIPAGLVLFLVWANRWVKVGLKMRLIMNLLCLVYGAFIFYGLATSFGCMYAAGPAAMIDFMLTPEWQRTLCRSVAWFLIPLMPLGPYFILRLANKKVPLKWLLSSTLGIMLSIPISIFILDLIDHRGGADFIHAIKSGVLFPFWVLSMGLLVLGLDRFINKPGDI